MASTWLPVRREPSPLAVTAVACPRKGPIPCEISLLKCGQMHDAAPERCAELRCQKAVAFMPQLEELRGVSRATLRVFQAPRVEDDAPVVGGSGEIV